MTERWHSVSKLPPSQRYLAHIFHQKGTPGAQISHQRWHFCMETCCMQHASHTRRTSIAVPCSPSMARMQKSFWIFHLFLSQLVPPTRPLFITIGRVFCDRLWHTKHRAFRGPHRQILSMMKQCAQRCRSPQWGKLRLKNAFLSISTYIVPHYCIFMRY